MSLSVVTTALDGTYRVRLDALGVVGGVKYASAWPYGCTTFSCTLAVPEDFSHQGLRPGRRLHVYDGVQRVWTGVLGDPQRGTSWQVTGHGLASLASDYSAVNDTATTSSAADLSAAPNTAVDAAISRGLPWFRASSLPAQSGGSGQTLDTVTQVLDSSCAAVSKRWAVFADGQIIADTDPTSPAYIAIATDTPGSRSVDGFVTHLYGRYINSSTSSVKVASAAASTSGPVFGRFETTIDITDLGPMLPLAAQNILAGRLALMNTDPTFTGSLTVQPGALRDLGGVPVALSTVRAGRMIEVRGAAQDPGLGNLNYATRVQLILGEVEYDADADLIRLTPVGALRRDLVSVLARAAA